MVRYFTSAGNALEKLGRFPGHSFEIHIIERDVRKEDWDSYDRMNEMILQFLEDPGMSG